MNRSLDLRVLSNVYAQSTIKGDYGREGAMLKSHDDTFENRNQQDVTFYNTSRTRKSTVELKQKKRKEQSPTQKLKQIAKARKLL